MAIQYVGGVVGQRAGATSTQAQSLTALTGGIATAPAPNDLVIVTCVTGTSGRNPSQAIPGFTTIGTQLLADGTTYDTALQVSYKFMANPADTSITIPSSGNVADGQAWTVQVFRGVNREAPFDVAAVSATGTGSQRANPPAITPVTTGSWVVICTGGAASTGANFTFSDLSGVLTATAVDTNDATVGSGYKSDWSSGAFNSATSTTGSALAADSWAAWAIALRPTAPFSALTDDFSSGTLPAGKYNQSVPGNGSQTVVNGELVQTLTTGVAGWPTLFSFDEYDLTNSRLFIRLVQPLQNTVGGESQFRLVNIARISDWIQLGVYEGNFQCNRSLNGVQTFVAGAIYDPAVHTWLSMRADATNIYLETAPASASNPPVTGDWSLFATVSLATLGWTPNTAYLHLYSGHGTNTGAPTAPGKWDGLNTGSNPTLIQDFVENFNAALDENKWDVATNPGGAVSVVSGEAQLQHNFDDNPVAGTHPSVFTSLTAKSGYKLQGSSIYWRFKPVMIDDAGQGYAIGTYTHVGVANPTGDEGVFFMHQSAWNAAGTLKCLVVNDLTDEWWVEVGTITGYNPSGSHAWLRIREDSGTWYWDTAPDNSGVPGSWTNQFSYSTTGSGVNLDSLTNLQQAAKFQTRIYHWNNNLQESYIVENARVDGINGTAVTSTPTHHTSAADPAVYALTPQAAASSVGRVSIALPTVYGHTPFATGQAFGKVSIALPATYSMSGATTRDVMGLSSVALPAAYSMTGVAANSGRSHLSIALPAAYSMTGAATTEFEAHNFLSIANPAVYTMNGMSTTHKVARTSWAIPAAFLMVTYDTTDVTTGHEEEHVFEKPVGLKPIGEIEFLDWIRDPNAIRVVLVETECRDDHGNTQFLYFGSRGFVTKTEDGLQARAYLPLIKGGLDFKQTLGLDLSGSMSYGDIELDNTEGDLDALFDRVWRYQPLRAYVGDVRWPRRDFRQIFDGVVEDIDSSDRGTINVRLRDKLYRLDMPLHEEKVGGTNSNPNQLLPVAFGECHNITPVLVDANELRYAYHVRKAEGVFEVRDNGVPIQRLTNPGPPATFTLPKQPAGRVTASVQGDAAGTGTAGATGYNNTVPELVYRLATQWGTESGKRFTDNDFDDENFRDFALNNRAPVGLYSTERLTVLEACQQIAAAVGARLTMTARGKLQLVRVQVPPMGTPIEVGESDMLAGSLRIVNRLPITPATRLGYCKNWTVQEDTTSGLPEEHKALFAREWLTVTAVNQVTRDLYDLWGEPDQENCLLLVEDDAVVECQRRTSLRSYQRHVFEFVGFADLIMTPVGAAMRLTHRRFGLLAGKTGQVVSVAVNWLNATVTIQVVI